MATYIDCMKAAPRRARMDADEAVMLLAMREAIGFQYAKPLR